MDCKNNSSSIKWYIYMLKLFHNKCHAFQQLRYLHTHYHIEQSFDEENIDDFNE